MKLSLAAGKSHGGFHSRGGWKCTRPIVRDAWQGGISLPVRGVSPLPSLTTTSWRERERESEGGAWRRKAEQSYEGRSCRGCHVGRSYASPGAIRSFPNGHSSTKLLLGYPPLQVPPRAQLFSPPPNNV